MNMVRMDILAPMRAFVRVAETGSFSAVAAELGTTQPTISRQIALLEDHLGTRLFTRSTRAVTLTEDGRAFWDHALRALEALGEAENAVGRRLRRPSGTLRMVVPVVFGRLQIVPRLAQFMARYPDISIDLTMSDGFTDLVEQGVELAIRVGTVTDLALVARRIGEVRRLTVASPAYLDRHAPPPTPADLASHDCIVYSRLATGSVWHFSGPAGPISVDVRGRFRVDNSEGVREGVLAGLGIAVVPEFVFSNEIAAGRVRVVLAGYEPKPLPLQAVYPSRRYVPPRVRAMIDFLVEQFGAGTAMPASG